MAPELKEAKIRCLRRRSSPHFHQNEMKHKRQTNNTGVGYFYNKTKINDLSKSTKFGRSAKWSNEIR